MPEHEAWYDSALGRGEGVQATMSVQQERGGSEPTAARTLLVSMNSWYWDRKEPDTAWVSLHTPSRMNWKVTCVRKKSGLARPTATRVCTKHKAHKQVQLQQQGGKGGREAAYKAWGLQAKHATRHTPPTPGAHPYRAHDPAAQHTSMREFMNQVGPAAKVGSQQSMRHMSA